MSTIATGRVQLVNAKDPNATGQVQFDIYWFVSISFYKASYSQRKFTCTFSPDPIKPASFTTSKTTTTKFQNEKLNNGNSIVQNDLHECGIIQPFKEYFKRVFSNIEELKYTVYKCQSSI